MPQRRIVIEHRAPAFNGASFGMTIASVGSLSTSNYSLVDIGQRFFGDGGYAVVGPYTAEVWPAGLRASGMGFGFGIGNFGKIIGPLGLALVIGTSDYVSPKATLDAIFPALLFLAFWYGQAALVFLFIGFETKGRSIEEIDASLERRGGQARRP